MPRTARVVVPGEPHHITQRGIRRFEIFRDHEDRISYLELFLESCHLYALQILAYCLMTNHVHYIAIPERADSFYRVFHRAHGIYAQRFNFKYGLVGHLWQDRPFSCVLDEIHLRHAVRYVEQNPVRARMVARAEDYPWSSAAAHCGLRTDPLLATSEKAPVDASDWSKWLEVQIDDDSLDFLRSCTATGRPCGEDPFVQRVGQMTHRDFTRKKTGPKPAPRSDESLLLDCSEDRIVR